MSYISDLKHIVVGLPILQTSCDTRNREWSWVWVKVGNGNYPIIRLSRNPKKGCV